MTGTNTQAAKRCLLIVLLACILIGSQAAKVLVATTPVGKSHMMNLKMIAMEVERRGHSVMVSRHSPFNNQQQLRCMATRFISVMPWLGNNPVLASSKTTSLCAVGDHGSRC